MSDRTLSMIWILLAVAVALFTAALVSPYHAASLEHGLLLSLGGLVLGCGVHGVGAVADALVDGLRGSAPDPVRAQGSVRVLKTLRWGLLVVGLAGVLVFMISGAWSTRDGDDRIVAFLLLHVEKALVVGLACVTLGEFSGGLLRRRLEASCRR